MNSSDYTVFLSDLSSEIVKRHQQNERVSPEAIISQLLPGHPDNLRIRTLAMGLGITTGARWDREEKKAADGAVRDAKVVAVLGRRPTGLRDFVALSAARYGWQVRYQGEIVTTDGTLIIAPQIKTVLIIDDDELELGYRDARIGHVVDEWIAAEKRIRFDIIFASISCLPETKCRAALEEQLVEACGQYFTGNGEFAAAAIRKLIWQVKRKATRALIGEHHMVILRGRQKCGKTSIVKAICHQLEEATANIAFDQLTDGRNMGMWSNLILNTDELAHAKRADMAALKNCVTATTMSIRVLGTGAMASVEQRATMIGTSNKELSRVIHDPTGMRRFIELVVRNNSSEADFQRLRDLDWLAIWQMVDPNFADPMAGHTVELAEVQGRSRSQSKVEEFLDHWENDKDLHRSNEYTSTELYELFKDWEEGAYPGTFNRTSHKVFGQDILALVRDNEAHGWGVRERGKQNFYKYTRAC